MDNNWIIENLENAFHTWNGKLAEIWSLLSTTPQEFKGGGVWGVMTGINGALQGIGYGLLVLFLAIGIFGSTLNFQDFKRPEQALRFFIRFVAAKAAVTYGMELMVALFDICFGVISTVAGRMGSMTTATVSLPGEIQTAITEMGFFESIPLWLVTLIGSLFITVLSFVLILTVYGRFFKLYMYTALAPIPLSTFAAESTASTGKTFLKSYIGVCLEGAVIVLACLIFTGFIDGDPVYSGASAVTMAWSYIGEVIFNMLVLVALVKGSDRIIKEMLGL